MICEKCGFDVQVGDYPFCKGKWSDHEGGRYGVIGDDIPGGMYVRHGLCHEDGTPKRYDSKSAMAAEAKKRGLTNYVAWQPGDKHVSRWI